MSSNQCKPFLFCDLKLDPMLLILKTDLDITITNIELSISTLQTFVAKTDRHTYAAEMTNVFQN